MRVQHNVNMKCYSAFFGRNNAIQKWGGGLLHLEKIYLILQPITARPSLREVYQILVGSIRVGLGVFGRSVCVWWGMCIGELWVGVCV